MAKKKIEVDAISYTIQSDVNGVYYLNQNENTFSVTWWRNGQSETIGNFKTEDEAKEAIKQNEQTIK